MLSAIDKVQRGHANTPVSMPRANAALRPVRCDDVTWGPLVFPVLTEMTWGHCLPVVGVINMGHAAGVVAEPHSPHVVTPRGSVQPGIERQWDSLDGRLFRAAWERGCRPVHIR